MKKAEVQIPIPLSLRQVEMTIYSLKIWRQVVVGQTFMELRDGNPTPYQETLVEIDLAIEKFERAKGEF